MRMQLSVTGLDEGKPSVVSVFLWVSREPSKSQSTHRQLL